MSLPSGILLPWAGTVASIPAGWTPVAALATRFPKCTPTLGTGPGAIGGSTAHTHPDSGHAHTGPSHTHPGSAAFAAILPFVNSLFTVGSPISPPDHFHPVTLAAATVNFQSALGGWQTSVSQPSYYDVIWIQSPGRWKLPPNILALWTTDTAPTGCVNYTLAAGRLLRGARSGTQGGTTGGAPVHVHLPPGQHTHVNVAGDHTHGMSAVSNDVRNPGLPLSFPTQAGSMGMANHPHTHPTGSATGITESSVGTTGPSSGSTDLTPPYLVLALVQCTPAAIVVPVGTIALWPNAVSTLGTGWAYCDGANGTPDLRDRFPRMTAAPAGADLLTTGGAAGHSHSAPAAHTHATNGHPFPNDTGGHTLSIPDETDAAFAGYLNPSTGDQVTANPHSHTYPFSNELVVPRADSVGTTSGTVQPIGADADSRPPWTEVAFVMYLGPSFAVTVTAPTVSQVETSPTPTVSWTLPGGHTQAHYRVSILDVTQTSVVYDSGWIASAAGTIAVPTGILENLTSYYAVVDVDDTLGAYGESALVPFSTAFTPSAAPTGLTAVQFGGDGTRSVFGDLTASPSLPGVLLTWNAYVPVGGDTFQYWTVARRLHGTVPWTALTTIATVGTTTYTDYTASGSVEYDYTVSYHVLRWTVYSIESVLATPASLTVRFTGVWIHVLTNTALALRYDASAGTIQPVQDQRVVAVWGRKEPTVHIGFQHWYQFQFTGVYVAFPDISAWETIFAFAEDAAEHGTVLVIRYGNTGEFFYGVIDRGNTSHNRTDEAFGWESVLQINQVFFDGGA